MNSPQRHKYADILIALAEGKTIEHRYYTDNEWYALTPDGIFEHLINATKGTSSFRVAPEKKEGWINIYPGSYSDGVFGSKEVATQMVKRNLERIACIQITYTPGEGLE